MYINFKVYKYKCGHKNSRNDRPSCTDIHLNMFTLTLLCSMIIIIVYYSSVTKTKSLNSKLFTGQYKTVAIGNCWQIKTMVTL